jgi:signal peptidase II
MSDVPRPNALIWLLLSGLLIGLDLWTKQIALDNLQPHQPVVFIEGFWNWTLTFNPGAAFSFLGDASGWQRWLFACLAIGISLMLTFWLARTPRNDWRQALPYALIIGGALGNLVDRLRCANEHRCGHVVDFIDWYWRGYHWPAFNIADSAIVGGAIGLALFGLLMPQRSETQS